MEAENELTEEETRRLKEIEEKLGLSEEGPETEEDVIDEQPSAQEPEEPQEEETEEVEEAEKPVQEEPVSEESSEEVDDEPSNDAFAKMRIKMREMEKELAESKQKPSEAPEPQKAEQTPDADAQTVLRALVRAKEGDVPEGTDASQVVRMAEDVISKHLTSSEIAKVLSEARKGNYGEYSEMMASEAQQAFMIAQSRETSETFDSTQAEQEARQVYDSELSVIEKHMPEFLDPESAEHQAIPKWIETYIGKIGDNGEIVERGIFDENIANYFRLHPLEICKAVSAQIQQSKMLEAAQQGKVKAARKTAALADSPATGSPAVSVDQKGKSRHEQIEEKLFELARQTNSIRSDSIF